MIGKLKGVVSVITQHYLILDVSGVGYLVFATSSFLHQIQLQQDVDLWIETYLRQDKLHLYGFSSQLEKECFVLINSVSGAGAKVALCILSHVPAQQFYHIVETQNKDALECIHGVGSKLAQRLLLELRKKIRVVSHLLPHDLCDQCALDGSQDLLNDAVSILVNLGLNKKLIHAYVASLLLERPEMELDEVVRSALLQYS